MASKQSLGDEEESSSFEVFVGGCVLTMVVLMNYAGALCTLYLLVRCLVYRSLADFVKGVVWVALGQVPTVRSETVRTSWLFRCTAKYFRTQSLLEAPVDEYRQALRHRPPSAKAATGEAPSSAGTVETAGSGGTKSGGSRHFLFLAFPHGALSLGGLSALTIADKEFCGVTAVADVILHVPLLKSIYGFFGIIGSSRQAIKTALQTENVFLYPGGVAEMFLTSRTTEELYFERRKGCIKVAMMSGAVIVPCYIFGNSHLLNVLRLNSAGWVSRLLRSATTYVWGRWGLPIPYRTKVNFVVGTPIATPDKRGLEVSITDEEVGALHKQVRDEVERLYMKYRQIHPEYAKKPLVIH